MTPPVRGLSSWQPRDVLMLAKSVKASIDASMECFNSMSSETALKMKPTFITEEVIASAKNLLEDERNRDPIIVIDIGADKTEIAFIIMHGPEINQMLVADKWVVKNADEFKHNIYEFLGNIAKLCHRMVNRFVHSFGKVGGARKVLCAINYGDCMDQTSLSDSTVSKFTMKNFSIGNCEGRDLVRLLNGQLIDHQESSLFSIECTHMLNRSVMSMMGFCMQETPEIPDVVLFVNFGNNICFFDEGHNMGGPLSGQRMLISSDIFKFGTAGSVLEFNLLHRFLRRHDFEIIEVHKDHCELFDLFMGAFIMCDAVWKFLKKKVPDFIEKFPLFSNPKEITDEDISDLIESVGSKTASNGRLCKIYAEIKDEETRTELYEYCTELRDRAARMLAGVTYGVMKRVSSVAQKKKIILGLDGRVMSTMYGYRSKFMDMLHQLQTWDAKANEGKALSFDVVCKNSSDTSAYFGAVGVSKYVWESAYQKS